MATGGITAACKYCKKYWKAACTVIILNRGSARILEVVNISIKMYKYTMISLIIHGIFTNWNFINMATSGRCNAVRFVCLEQTFTWISFFMIAF